MKLNIGHTWNSWEDIKTLDITAFHNPIIHHIGIVAPFDTSVNTLLQLCENIVDFPEQRLFMGYTHSKVDNVKIEVIKPYSDKSPLKRYLTSSVWTLDHFCYRADLIEKPEMVIGKKFYSQLWEKYCQFFLDNELNKIELIYEY